MGWHKRLVRADLSRRIVCWLVQFYIRIVYLTGRWRVEGGDIPRRLHAERRPFILAFWHGRLLMMPMVWRHLAPMHMLISGHADGRIIAEAVRYFGICSVDGSTTEGGSGALRIMVRHLRAGDCVGITPDAPSGPAMRATQGIVAAAKLSGVPIVPISYATSRRRILATWDRFHLPFPLSRGIFIWGEPIVIPSDLEADELEAWRVRVEERMNALTAEADRRVGHTAVAPGTLPRDALRAERRAAREGG
jgi:lysophospholipid acyltransferase (LPLAT)-like uncharacterized protein